MIVNIVSIICPYTKTLFFINFMPSLKYIKKNKKCVENNIKITYLSFDISNYHYCHVTFNYN